MRSFFYFLSFLFFPFFLNAQSQKWINYVNDHIINDIAFEDNYLWVGTQGGLVRIDRETEERQLYLPANSGMQGFGVESIYVSPDGVKWLGSTQAGLFRFDGQDWLQFQYINTGDTIISIYNMKAAPNGDFWISARVNKGCPGCTKFYRFDGNTFTYMDLEFGPDPGNEGVVSYYDIAPNGNLWVIADDKIKEYDGNEVITTFTKNDIGLQPNENLNGLVITSNNETRCLITKYDQNVSQLGMRKYDGSQWSPVYFLGEEFHDGYQRAFFADTQGNTWLTYTLGGGEMVYVKYDGAAWQSWTKNSLTNIPNGYNSPQLLHVDEQGHWWLSYFLVDGMHLPKTFEYDGVNWKGYNSEIYPLGSNSAEDVLFDCENNVWFGGYKMLTKYDGITWKDYTLDDMGIPANYFDIWSLTLDTATCDIWISFYENNGDPIGFSKFDGTSFTNYSVPSGWDVFKVLIGPDGTVWVAAPSDGLGMFDGNNWTWYDEANSPLSNLTLDIALDQQGHVWVTSYGNGLAHFDGVNWTSYNPSNSPAPESIYWVFVDQSNVVWMYNGSDALQFDGTNWMNFPVTTEPFTLSSMAEDIHHNYWFGASDGVYFWNGNNFTKYDITNSPIGQNRAKEIKIDPYGNKWFVHGTGVSVFNENGISNRIINPPNSLRGQVFFDTDQDGVKAASGEPGLPGEKIQLEPDGLLTYSTFGGQYAFYPGPGNYEINFQPDAPYAPTTSSQLSLLMGNSDQNGFDFGAWSDDIPDSISVDLTASIARCNETTTVWINVTNHGLFPASGTVELTMHPGLDFISANQPPESIQGNVIMWEYQDLKPFEYDPIKVEFQSPGVDAVGEIIEFNAVATREENGNIVQSAKDYTNTEVRCSYDPNDKKAEATGEYLGNLSLLTNPLDFTIRFQNKGNDTAFVVVVRDTLDADLDPASFELISFSHPVRTTMTADGVLTFVFENINLLWESVNESASHGFVKYRITPRGNLPDPTDIENTAHIYFDFNPAIVTNTTENTLVETLPVTATGNTEKWDTEIVLYPNPTIKGFWVEWMASTISNTPWNVSIFDAAGRMYFSKKSTEKKVWISGLEAGFYVVVFEKEGKRIGKKLIVTSR